MARFLLTLAVLTTGVPASAATLALEECRISAGPSYPSIKADCGVLERPLNPEDPDAGTIELRVAVVPALNLEPQPDPLVPIAGGPGQGTVEFYTSYAYAFGDVQRDRDILLVDQRGTGESARMACLADEDMTTGQYSTELTVRYTEKCLDELPYDPRWFTTSVAVQDLEAVRIALGYPALNLYGVSYGSRVAQHFARRYPESTRTVVLDGVVPPQLPLGPEIATEAQRALDSILDRCEEDADCAQAFPDLEERFAEFREGLEEKPLRVKIPDPLTGKFEIVRFGNDELAGALRLLAYHPNTIAAIPLLLSEAADGNTRPLVAQFKLTVGEMSESISLGMHNAVMCAEDVPYYNESLIDEEALERSYMGPIQLEALEAICSVWPVGPVDEGFHEPLTTNIPVLLLSGTADPITPPRYADMAARSLMKAWLLTGQHQGHGQLGVGCVPRLIGEFVANSGLGDSDTSCINNSFVMPFFLDFSGPAP